MCHSVRKPSSSHKLLPSKSRYHDAADVACLPLLLLQQSGYCGRSLSGHLHGHDLSSSISVLILEIHNAVVAVPADVTSLGCHCPPNMFYASDCFFDIFQMMMMMMMMMFYTRTRAFTHKRFYTQTRSHTNAFTHRRVYTQTLLHTNAFTRRCFLHTQTRFHTQTLLHTDAFTHRHFYTNESVQRNFSSVFDVQRPFRAKELRLTK